MNFLLQKKNKNKGFTLVEILVSVALFSVVMIMVASMLLAIVGANAKAQTLKTTLDNLNVALENMTRSIRTGSSYSVDSSGSSFTFTNQEGNTETYALDGSGHITRQIVPDPTAVALTADNVHISSLKFFAFNTNASAGQPYVVIAIQGSAAGVGSRPSAQTSFSLEMAVTSRQPL